MDTHRLGDTRTICLNYAFRGGISPSQKSKRTTRLRSQSHHRLWLNPRHLAGARAFWRTEPILEHIDVLSGYRNWLYNISGSQTKTLVLGRATAWHAVWISFCDLVYGAKHLCSKTSVPLLHGYVDSYDPSLLVHHTVLHTRRASEAKRKSTKNQPLCSEAPCRYSFRYIPDYT